MDGGLDFAGAFLDADLAEVVGWWGWRCGGETDAVVGDGEVEVVFFEGGGDVDLGGLGVFEGVGEGFLGDHAEVMNGGAWE